MTATKNINTFQRYVSWILDKFMNSLADYEGFEDSPLWNIHVVFHSSELMLNREDTSHEYTSILKNPAYTDDWSTVTHTPKIALYCATHHEDINKMNAWTKDFYGIRELHMTPYQTYELCKAILFDMINTYTSYGFKYGHCDGDYDRYLDTNLKMFAFLAYEYADAKHTDKPELYDRAKRLVKSLNKRYIEIMTL